jgi:hypothetical protein
MLKFKEFVLILGFLVNFLSGWNNEDYGLQGLQITPTIP